MFSFMSSCLMCTQSTCHVELLLPFIPPDRSISVIWSSVISSFKDHTRECHPRCNLHDYPDLNGRYMTGNNDLLHCAIIDINVFPTHLKCCPPRLANAPNVR